MLRAPPEKQHCSSHRCKLVGPLVLQAEQGMAALERATDKVRLLQWTFVVGVGVGHLLRLVLATRQTMLWEMVAV